MSSWANRHVLRKRDISQIPEHSRPNIVPRIFREEVVSSESFKNNNEKKYDIITFNSKSNKNNSGNEYITKKIEPFLGPAIFELSHNNKSYVFVILRHLRKVQDNDLWISSYNSIRKYYSNKIIIIDDNSAINTVDGNLYNTEIIRSGFPGAGEILPYYYFLRRKWADKMIFLHDTMFLYRPFKDSEIESDIKFHWHFLSNSNEDYRKINHYISLLSNTTELQESINNTDFKWKGCFGGGMIISYDNVKLLEDTYNIFSTLSMTLKSRNDRMVFERLLGIICFQMELINQENCSNFGDILKYPGAFESENNNFETASHIIRQKGYDTAIVKVWRGR
jgi:hypothetical protein